VSDECAKYFEELKRRFQNCYILQVFMDKFSSYYSNLLLNAYNYNVSIMYGYARTRLALKEIITLAIFHRKVGRILH
jgi:hypothetical protein